MRRYCMTSHVCSVLYRYSLSNIKTNKAGKLFPCDPKKVVDVALRLHGMSVPVGSGCAARGWEIDGVKREKHGVYSVYEYAPCLLSPFMMKNLMLLFSYNMMTARLSRAMTIQRRMPCTIGLIPTLRSTSTERPLPMRKSVTVRPFLASHTRLPVSCVGSAM